MDHEILSPFKQTLNVKLAFTMTQKSLYLVFDYKVNALTKPNYELNIFFVIFSIRNERYGVKENPKNMPKDPPIEPINPDNVMMSISSMICLMSVVDTIVKTPAVETLLS